MKKINISKSIKITMIVGIVMIIILGIMVASHVNAETLLGVACFFLVCILVVFFAPLLFYLLQKINEKIEKKEQESDMIKQKTDKVVVKTKKEGQQETAKARELKYEEKIKKINKLRNDYKYCSAIQSQFMRKYNQILKIVDEIKKDKSFTQYQKNKLDQSVKEMQLDKNRVRISTLEKYYASFNIVKDSIEKLIKSKKDIDKQYKLIIKENECDEEQLKKAQEIKDDADKNFQWYIRNIIDKKQEESIELINNKYKNSKEHKKEVYVEFKDFISEHKKMYDEETKEFSKKSLRDLENKTKLDFDIIYEDKDEKTLDPIALIDDMEGITFERTCAQLLSQNGFKNVEVTQGSGDQGIDVLAEKDGIKYAIQCKRYSSKLGNTPVQEVHTGRKYYKCQIGVVMTNNYFTKGAVELADETGTLLWDRDKLIEMINNKDK